MSARLIENPTCATVEVDVAAELHRIVRRHYAHKEGGSKRLAEDAGSTQRTAANWMQGLNTPRSEQTLRLMAHHPALCRDVAALLARMREGR